MKEEDILDFEKPQGTNFRRGAFAIAVFYILILLTFLALAVSETTLVWTASHIYAMAFMKFFIITFVLKLVFIYQMTKHNEPKDYQYWVSSIVTLLILIACLLNLAV